MEVYQLKVILWAYAGWGEKLFGPGQNKVVNFLSGLF